MTLGVALGQRPPWRSEVATVEDVMSLLVARLATVMAVSADQIGAGTRFDEDLHADSLDLVEVIEGVERDLRAREETPALADDELVGLQTVGEAAERIAASTGGDG